jgi:hypothetical protein
MTSETLVPCKTCKVPVAKKASVCPKCGRGRPGGGTTTGVFILVGIVLLAGAGWLIIAAMGSAATGQQGVDLYNSVTVPTSSP